MFPEHRTRLSSEDVLALLDQQHAAMPDASDEALRFGVACEVAMILLGKRVFHAVFGDRDRHFVPDDSEGTGRFVYMQKVITLGTYLYECQSVENFESMRDDLASRTFLGVTHEVRCAALALRAGYSVRSIERSGVRGRDFDFMIDGRVALEVKAKQDDTAYSRSSLMSTLKKARSQLPSEGPGVVMVAIPDSWSLDRDFQAEIDGVIQELFRTSGRINAVFVMWDRWIPAPPTGMACLRMFRRLEHPRPRATGSNSIVAGLIEKLLLERAE